MLLQPKWQNLWGRFHRTPEFFFVWFFNQPSIHLSLCWVSPSANAKSPWIYYFAFLWDFSQLLFGILYPISWHSLSGLPELQSSYSVVTKLSNIFLIICHFKCKKVCLITSTTKSEELGFLVGLTFQFFSFFLPWLYPRFIQFYWVLSGSYWIMSRNLRKPQFLSTEVQGFPTSH